jgi:phospholipid transport system substrate-binding protein
MTSKLSKLRTSWGAALLTLAGVLAVQASTQSPEQVVQATADSLAAQLKGQRDRYAANRKELYGLVDRVLLPNFDTRYAGQLVLGKHWKTANESQRTRFIDAFYNFLLRSYAKSVLEFDQKNVRIFPPRGEPKNGRTVIHTEMKLDNGTTVPVDYSMRQTDAGWKAYDVRIEGISYVQNYRNQFNAEIAAKGVDAVIARLEGETAAIDAGKEPETPGDDKPASGKGGSAP